MISKEQVLKSAGLAKIKLTQAEEDKFSKELSGIIAYVDELKKVDTRGVEPVAHAIGLEDAFRKDSKEPNIHIPQGRELLNQAPKTKDGYVVVPRILADL
ncbi:MAG: hypothetical protein A3A80_04080 [Candidatus Terrybacteria bacterium RIFCSPLOWO2_01_FULL_44_24]|uniref:Aspartyl/glutamyl-tRNA(Asn/Gln) amidotransferase subunit C n=1 Tax=Candidatus Terrybacteria bacterium RIFCSPHIGHO2_01_FULL_43_35 TaxID=1802361 RepID=A0A1G2PGA0_9BACT|nr:MAG: hypothetical protein A2828_03005 [Candidatus Terrybacteria bacterium RIFCSPHIGHO2_01_FULL_43_35]OHA50188.1 MAG: hypothetical protein A3B75_01665 [Candidatus Terrybacteria bacterium RIFCSPHIGHO2_02_FULL_43_14]OHA51247.1 MAG: hypothetical protein A3A80_04080 [Candidatus Terrybacteria bacterium RIFCSPLOWO2_01_FULL_44_24]